jgi:large subunit ribosomal protein L18
MSKTAKLSSRERAKFRIRKKLIGNNQRPRLSVFRSLNNIYAQLIDDVGRKTLLSVSTLNNDVKAEIKDKATKLQKSKIVGKIIAKKALDLKINDVIFDRNGYIYHGRVKALAEGAREEGLHF